MRLRYVLNLINDGILWFSPRLCYVQLLNCELGVIIVSTPRYSLLDWEDFSVRLRFVPWLQFKLFRMISFFFRTPAGNTNNLNLFTWLGLSFHPTVLQAFEGPLLDGRLFRTSKVRYRVFYCGVFPDRVTG